MLPALRSRKYTYWFYALLFLSFSFYFSGKPKHEFPEGISQGGASVAPVLAPAEHLRGGAVNSTLPRTAGTCPDFKEHRPSQLCSTPKPATVFCLGVCLELSFPEERGCAPLRGWAGMCTPPLGLARPEEAPCPGGPHPPFLPQENLWSDKASSLWFSKPPRHQDPQGRRKSSPADPPGPEVRSPAVGAPYQP